MEYTTNEQFSLADELVSIANAYGGRCAELESALRKVDEIRHRLKAAVKARDMEGKLYQLDRLKAPCMMVKK